MKRALRFSVVAAGAWGLLIGISHVVRITPPLPMLGMALAIAAAVETLLFLYRYEAGAVAPGRARAIIALRLLAMAVLVWILIEPVWVRKVSRENPREVVVVIDDSDSMQLVDDGTEKTRSAIGQAALENSQLLTKLGETMRVRVVKAARSVREEGEDAAAGWSDSTDLAAALGTVLEQVPPDDLAGVVMVSDGRHNRPERVEDVARRFGILDAPVGIIAVGSEDAPKDAAVLSVRAPEAIHLGDRMRVTAQLKFDGYKGETAQVYLKQGEKVLETRDVAIPQDHHREEIRFARIPQDGGVNDYQIEIGGLEDERFAENNRWGFETSITDARTNVLIVEAYPRWEFRYLRNLFYGRDKSVHLQYVLMNPDQISYQENPAVAASAARRFGDALATRLPANEEEWRKFDVIILGDVDTKALSDPSWNIISRCVNERGALLVMIAGPRAMPHGITSEAGRALVPAELEFSARTYFNTGDEAFRWGLTADGQNHPITRQSDGGKTDAPLWSSFPTMMWRHPLMGVKQGAEVILTAESDAPAPTVASNAGLENALDDLAKRREREAKAALLVTRQTGKGKVALLLTDRTWRLREGSGDLHHHRFWGNLVRWGAGPVLRSGGLRARLGTDQLTYTPDDKPTVTARLRNTDLAPVDDTVVAEVIHGEKVISTVPMTPVKDSNGFYEASLNRFARDGKYTVRLRGPKTNALVREDGLTELTTGFQVIGTRGPVELAETTLNRPLLETIASLSGGQAVAADRAGELAGLFLTEKNARDEVRESSLWDSGWVLGLLAIVLASEWMLRRASGLP